MARFFNTTGPCNPDDHYILPPEAQGRERTVQKGLEQVLRYRDTIDRGAGAWLVVFDRTPAGRRKSWEELGGATELGAARNRGWRRDGGWGIGEP